MLKKAIPIVIAVLMLCYPGAAWLLGRAIEQRADGSVKELADKMPYLHVVESHFHRGWFVSEQDVIVEAAAIPGAGGSQPLRVTVHNVIHHGPICGLTCIGFAEVDTHLIYGEQLQAYLTPVFGAAEPLSIRTRLGFFGGGSASISSPPLPNVTFSNGSHLSSQGFSFGSSYAADFDAYSINGSLPHVLFKSADGMQIELSALGVDIHSKRALRSLYVGNSAINVGALSLSGVSKGAPTGPVTLKDVSADSISRMSDGFLSVTTKFGAASVATAPLTLTDVHFDFTLQHLDANALEQLSQASRIVDPAVDASPTERIGRMTAALKAPAITLFSHQPEISFDRIALTTAGGSALLTGTVKIHGLVAEDFGSSANPMGLLQKLDVDMDLGADEGFLTGLPGGSNASAQLQPFVSQGFLTHDGKRFHTLIAFHQGQATFNGKPFGLGAPAPK